MKYVVLSILIIGITALSALSFEAEELNFTLQKERWEMEGLYYFANYDTIAVAQLIYFPIPVDSVCLPATLKKIAIQEGKDAKVTMKKQTQNGFSFSLSLPAKSFCSVQIIYTQALKGNYAKYIITSANAWGRPLPYAKYTLRKGKKVEITALPFPVQKRKKDSYTWEFYDFVPDKDIAVHFVAKQNNKEK
ncbi:MAG: hypothetical protein ABFC98_04630 [Candidatus Cloacimonas sp.]